MKHYRTALGLILLLSLVLMAACGAPADGGMAAEEAPAAEEAAADDEVVEIEETEEEAMELSGEIVVSIASNDVQTYQALHGVASGRDRPG